MALTSSDKRWLVRLAQTVVYLIVTHYAYPGMNKPHTERAKALRNHFASLLAEDDAGK